MSVNLSQEQVGDEWRTRVDGVVGYHYALGQWDISVAGSIGQGDLEGVGSQWYSVGADAWLEARQQGPFVRVTQQFAREDAREVESVRLSNWQNQTLLSAIGWRGQTYLQGFDLNASVGIENRQSHSTGQVSVGIGTQNITDLPDETEGFVSFGLASTNDSQSMALCCATLQWTNGICPELGVLVCELLAMSANVPTDIRFSFKGLAVRGGEVGPHRDGFGIVFYHGKGLQEFRDVDASCDSPVARLVEDLPIRSKAVIAHVRQANAGAVNLENTHPFHRELFGRHFTFAHNGQLPGVKTAVGTI